MEGFAMLVSYAHQAWYRVAEGAVMTCCGLELRLQAYVASSTRANFSHLAPPGRSS